MRFRAAQRGNGGGFNRVEVRLDGVALGAFTAAGTGYEEVVVPAFTTSAGTHTLSFVGLNTAGDNTTFIDDVRVSSGGGGAGTAINWLVADHLGTPRIILDQTGSLAGVKRRDHLPFGEELGAGVGGRTTSQGYSQADGVRQKWHTLEHDDETGLDFAEARYYSSAQGRFTSVDPLIASARRRTPQSWNRYSYGINNPLKYVDPSGEAWITGPGGRTRFDSRIKDADDLKEFGYGKGWSIIDGQTRVVTSGGEANGIPFTKKVLNAPTACGGDG